MIGGIFQEKDFTCSCCKQLALSEKLINMLVSFHDRIKKDFDIHCVNRCPKHNKEVGGVANSLHLTGAACDFHVPGLQIAELQTIVLSSDDIFTGGIGLYNTFVHVDAGKKRIWDKRNV